MQSGNIAVVCRDYAYVVNALAVQFGMFSVYMVVDVDE